MTATDLLKLLWYRFLQLLARTACTLLFRIRISGLEHLPSSGGGLLVANHQSYLDPILVGVGPPRPLNYIAQIELFGFAPFRWLIVSLDAIPIRAQTLGLGGIKESLRRLRQGKLVLIFPEGGRSYDGHLAPLRPGFCTLANRAHVPVIPVGIHGAYEAWPRWNKIFRPHPIAVCFGPPIPPEKFRGLSEETAVELVRQRIVDVCCQAKALASGGKLSGKSA